MHEMLKLCHFCIVNCPFFILLSILDVLFNAVLLHPPSLISMQRSIILQHATVVFFLPFYNTLYKKQLKTKGVPFAPASPFSLLHLHTFRKS